MQRYYVGIMSLLVSLVMYDITHDRTIVTRRIKAGEMPTRYFLNGDDAHPGGEQMLMFIGPARRICTLLLQVRLKNL